MSAHNTLEPSHAVMYTFNITQSIPPEISGSWGKGVVGSGVESLGDRVQEV